MPKRKVCSFCAGQNRAKYEVEIVSKESGDVLGVAQMCEECLRIKKRELNRWFEYRERER